MVIVTFGFLISHHVEALVEEANIVHIYYYLVDQSLLYIWKISINVAVTEYVAVQYALEFAV